MMAHTYDPSIYEAKGEGWQARSQLDYATLSHKNKNNLCITQNHMSDCRYTDTYRACVCA